MTATHPLHRPLWGFRGIAPGPVDVAGLDMDGYGALSDEDRRALEEGPEPEPAEPPPAAAGAPDPAAPAAAEPAADPAAATEPAPEAPPATPGPTPEQLQAAINDPRFLMAQLQRLGFQSGQAATPPAAAQPPAAQPPTAPPDLFLDPEAAIAHHIGAAISPLQAQVQQLLAKNQQLEQQAAVQQLAQQYGPEAPQMIAHLDTHAPHLRGLPPELKVLIAHGLQATDPAAKATREAATAEQAKALAAKNVEAALAASPRGAPVTLGKAPAAVAPQAPDPDIHAMSQEDFNKLPAADLDRLMRNY